LYAVGFREGSYVHDYWNYWLVITLVLGVGAIASLLVRLGGRWWLAAGCLLAVALVAFGFSAELGEQRLRTDGERYARSDAGFTQRAKRQRWVPLVGDSLGPPGSSAAWVFPEARFYFGVPVRFATAAQAASFAKRHPDAWIALSSGVVGGGELVRGRDALTRLGDSS
jgi:hypothetical protein